MNIMERITEMPMGTRPAPRRGRPPIHRHAEVKPASPQASSSVVLVTPEMARHMRDTMHFARQRKLSQQNISRLALEMAAGRFTPGTQIYITVLPDGTELVINGNHTLEAVFKSGNAQFLTITRVFVANEDEAGKIYSVFDIHKTRSWTDSLRAVGMEGITVNSAKFVAGINFLKSGFGHNFGTPSQSRSEVFELMEEYKDAAEILHHARQGGDQTLYAYINRSPVMAVALATARYQPVAAEEFWSAVARDNGLHVGMPAKTLITYLRDHKAGGGERQKNMAMACALAWNAYFEGRELARLNVGLAKEFKLRGTAWDKGI
jgi:hypothetical protein